MRSSRQFSLAELPHNSVGPGGLRIVRCPVCGRLGANRRNKRGIAAIVHGGAWDIINGQRILRVSDSCITAWRERHQAA